MNLRIICLEQRIDKRSYGRIGEDDEKTDEEQNGDERRHPPFLLRPNICEYFFEEFHDIALLL